MRARGLRHTGCAYARGHGVNAMRAAPDPMNGGIALPLAADVQEGLVAACNDLDRLAQLLDDAARTLMASFHAVAVGLETPGAPAGGPREAGTALPPHLGEAITALQFHDLGTQLIAHTRRRLQNCVDRLAQDAFGSDEDGEAAVEQAPLRANPVTCAEMDAGSVELFG